VDRDLRASLVAACAAAALSALVGIIAGVGFLILVLRAIMGGLLMGAAVYGGILVVKRSLPGLLDSENPPGQESGIESLAVPEMGGNVDIVLPGEGAEPFVASPDTIAAEMAQGAGLQDSESLLDNPEPKIAKSEAEDVEEMADNDEPSLLEPEEAAYESEAAIPGDAGGESGRRSSVGFDELDVLPDLDGFSDSFTASEFSSGGSSAGRSDGQSSAAVPGRTSPAPRDAHGNVDSVALAQAVRTILKRDQKG
jgi:hypothetical protein